MKKATFILLCASLLILLASACAAAADSETSPKELNEGEAPETESVEPDPFELYGLPYTDVAASDPAYEAIRYVSYRGYMRGAGESRFSPDGLVTRLAAGTVLFRIEEARPAPDVELVEWVEDVSTGAQIRVSTAPSASKDVEPAEALLPGGEYLISVAPAPTPLEWAADVGIIRDGAQKNLSESSLMTRCEWAVFLQRYAAYRGCDTSASGDLSAHIDAQTVPSYAKEAMSWAVETGLFTPLAGISLEPNIAVSRSQLAQTVVALEALLTGDANAVRIAEAFESSAGTTVSRQFHEQIQEAVDAAAAKYGAVGIQAAVIEDGHVTDTYAWGWATKGSDSMTADHKMRIASLSKIVVGMDAMLLRERGLVHLDDSIGNYWGITVRNPHHPNTPVSIQSILSHTSSISLALDGSSLDGNTVKTRLATGSAFSSLTPGSMGSWGYNNYAFGVLGMTLENAAGKNMTEMLNAWLFNAMDIDGAYAAGDLESDRLVTLYYHDGRVARTVEAQRNMHTPAAGSKGTYFAGGLVISAHDLGKLTALLANDGTYEGLRLMSESSVATMEQSMGQTSAGYEQCLPLRWRSDMYGREGLYYHTGSAYGVYNGLSYDPAERDGVVVLTVGASAAKDSAGMYAVCGDISRYIYSVLQSD